MLIIKRIDFLYLPDIVPSKINKGNAVNIYLGMLDRVPVNVGTNIANQEKIRYEVRILCL